DAVGRGGDRDEVGAEDQSGAHAVEHVGETDVALKTGFAQAFDRDLAARDDGGGGQKIGRVGGVGFDEVVGRPVGSGFDADSGKGVVNMGAPAEGGHEGEGHFDVGATGDRAVES